MASLLKNLKKISSEPSELFKDLSDADRKENRLCVEIAKNIYDARKAKGLSQADLGKLLGVSQASVSQYESGDCNYTIETLAKIVSALGFDVEIRFTDSESSPVVHDTYHHTSSNITEFSARMRHQTAKEG